MRGRGKASGGGSSGRSAPKETQKQKPKEKPQEKRSSDDLDEAGTQQTVSKRKDQPARREILTSVVRVVHNWFITQPIMKST